MWHGLGITIRVNGYGGLFEEARNYVISKETLAQPRYGPSKYKFRILILHSTFSYDIRLQTYLNIILYLIK